MTMGAGVSISSSIGSSPLAGVFGIGVLPVKMRREASARRTVAPAILGGKSTSPWNIRKSPEPTMRASQFTVRVSVATLSPTLERRGRDFTLTGALEIVSAFSEPLPYARLMTSQLPSSPRMSFHPRQMGRISDHIRSRPLPSCREILLLCRRL